MTTRRRVTCAFQKKCEYRFRLLFLLLFAKRGDTGRTEIHLGVHLPIPLIVADIGEVVALFLVVLEPAEHIADVGLAFFSLSSAKLRGYQVTAYKKTGGKVCTFPPVFSAVSHWRGELPNTAICGVRPLF